MRRTRVAAVVAVTAAAVGLVVGCSGVGDGGRGGPTSDAPALPPGVETLRTLIDEPAPTPTLTVGDELVTDGVDLTRYAVSYPSGDLTITGLLAVPDGDGRHPALVVLHGYERTSYDPVRSMAGYYGPLVEAGYPAGRGRVRGPVPRPAQLRRLGQGRRRVGRPQHGRDA